MKRKQKTIEPAVFFTSAIVIILFVLIGITFTDQFSNAMKWMHTIMTQSFGWWFILAVSGYFLFTIWLIFGRYAHVRLGSDNEKPKYSFASWMAMLFSAGMGIGLLFYGVAEPIMHFANPPTGDAETILAAKNALRITFFHWGVHAWAIYTIVGLSLAYFGYRKGLPLTIRSALYPLLGEKIYGPWGHAVDTLAVFGTLFGVATSLGLGVMQVNSGLNYLFDIEQSTNTQLILITLITFCATASVVSGLDKGIKKLSEINMLLGAALMLFVIVVGPTVFIFKAFLQDIGTYAQGLFSQMLWTDAFTNTGWQNGWTIFYWAWWIAWAPFVGMFIARISRGRTIREFSSAVLLVPTLLTFLWFSVFGGTALQLELAGKLDLISAVNANVSTAIFHFLEYFPFAAISSFLATVVVITFFVTSSDSGSFVIDIITSGGHPNPPVYQRIFWALLEGVVAAILLIGGGIKAMQTASIATALPFSVVIVLMAVGLVKSLVKTEKARLHHSFHKEEKPKIASEEA